MATKDNSTGCSSLSFYGNDNKATYDIGDTNWYPFDMAYYNGKIFKAYFGLQSNAYAGDVKKIIYYWHDPADPPQESPNQNILPNTDHVTAFRFVILNGELYLFLAQKDGDNLKLHYKKYVSMGNTPSEDSWTGRTEIRSEPGEVLGLLAATFSDGIHILYQKKGYGYANEIIFDGTTVTKTRQGFNFSSFEGGLKNSCILNSDIFFRQSDGQQCLAIVTKDDAYQNPEGACGLFVYDPAAQVFSKICQLPNLSRDIAVAYGNIEDSKPYNKSNIQIWSLGWTDEKLKHIQCTISDDALSGTLHDATWNNICDTYSDARCSSHDHTDKRGYLSAKLSVSQDTEDSSLLITNIWVWWYGHTESYVHGRSFKYKSNYLKYKQTEVYDSINDGPGPSWQLLGIIMGFPPYYPNGCSGTPLGNIFVQYGQDQSNTITTAGSAQASFGISLGKSFGPPKTPFASIGFSIADSFAQTLSNTTTLSKSFYEKLSAASSDLEGNTAWGVFLVPYMRNNLYELIAPDGTTDMDYELYYMYIDSDSSSVQCLPFDMTAPGSDNNGYFKGITTPDKKNSYPNSKDFESWADGIYDLGTVSTKDYDMVFTNSVTGGGDGGSQAYTISKAVLGSDTHSNTLKITLSAKFFGFGTEDSFTLTTSTAVSSTVKNNMGVSCGLPPCNDNDPLPADFDNYLYLITDRFFLLNPKTINCFWIPDSCKEKGIKQLPWCLTWHVDSYTKEVDKFPVYFFF